MMKPQVLVNFSESPCKDCFVGEDLCNQTFARTLSSYYGAMMQTPRFVLTELSNVFGLASEKIRKTIRARSNWFRGQTNEPNHTK